MREDQCGAGVSRALRHRRARLAAAGGGEREEWRRPGRQTGAGARDSPLLLCAFERGDVVAMARAAIRLRCAVAV